MNKIGFNVSTVGNHEFDYGVEQLKKLEENITSRYITANFCYRKNKTTLFNPYKIVEIGGKKIDFIGAVTPLTLSKTYLSSIKDEDGELLYDFSAGDDIQVLADNIQGYIDKVRNDEKVDYVILLSHIGMSTEQYKSEELLSKLENVDAILDGHTHKVYNLTNPDKNKKEIYTTQTGTK
jgi:2',3'-cyclic-nucleotide 2'-phosphodiesterase (5'-nucleotidase family)